MYVILRCISSVGFVYRIFTRRWGLPQVFFYSQIWRLHDIFYGFFLNWIKLYWCWNVCFVKASNIWYCFLYMVRYFFFFSDKCSVDLLFFLLWLLFISDSIKLLLDNWWVNVDRPEDGVFLDFHFQEPYLVNFEDLQRYIIIRSNCHGNNNAHSVFADFDQLCVIWLFSLCIL